MRNHQVKLISILLEFVHHILILSDSPEGSDCGLLHPVGVPWGKPAAGEKSVGQNPHSPQSVALQVNAHVHAHPPMR